ncbi:MAG: tetratricopeptide repeat protein [Trueperaceae bacterium]
MDVTTSRLTARLLGAPRFEWRGEAVAPASRKGAALLALLAAHRGGLRREEMAEFLWEAGKLASVRQALYELRKLSGAELWLVEEGSLVRLEVASDAAAFEDALADANPEAALEHYEGAFLAGFEDVNVPAFLDWLALERQRLELAFLKALSADAKRLESEGQFGAARLRIQRALAADPLDEGLYRTGMRLAYVQGDVEGAKELLNRCAAMTRREFGSEPSAETLELAAAIERGQPLPVSADLSNLPLPHLRLLQALAIGAGVLGVEETARVIERPSFDVAADLGALESRGLVSAHLTVAPAFLAQVLTSLPVALRRLLHERIAEVLIAGDKVDQAVVAGHLLSAGNPAAAAPRFLQAANKALARSDLAAAKLLLFRLLWADDGSEVGSLRIEGCLLLEGVASQTGDEELQDAALVEAERLAWFKQSDAHLADVRIRRSRQQLRRGERGEALELALEALAIGVRLKDDSLVAKARNSVGGAQFYTGDLDGAAESFRTNLAAADAVERFRANNNLGSLSAIRGSLEDAYTYFETALTLARSHATRAEVGATLNNLAATAERLSDYGAAVKHFREGLDLARKDRAAVMEGQMLVNLAVIYKRQGHFGPAWNTALEVEELATELDDLRLAAHALELQAEVKRSCGRLTESIPLQQQAVAKVRELGDDRRVLTLGAQLTVMQHVAGQAPFEEAEDALERLEEARLHDIINWLWIEMAMATRAGGAVESLLNRMGPGVTNRHMRLQMGLARLRAALLPEAPAVSAGSDAAEELVLLAQRLVGEEPADGAGGKASGGASAVSLRALEVAERPYGWWLLRRFYERHGADLLGATPTWFTEPEEEYVQHALEQQAAGLPKALRASLVELPARWQADLGAD